MRGAASNLEAPQTIASNTAVLPTAPLQCKLRVTAMPTWGVCAVQLGTGQTPRRPHDKPRPLTTQHDLFCAVLLLDKEAQTAPTLQTLGMARPSS